MKRLLKKEKNAMRSAIFRLVIAVSMCVLFTCGIGVVYADEPAYLNGAMEGFVFAGKPETTLPAPIAGALIELFNEESNISPVASATTDERGHYRVGDLSHGPYSVRVSAENFTTLNTIVWINEGMVLKQDFYLEATTTVQSGLLKGRVVQDVGMLTIVPPPIPGAHVRVYKSLVNSTGEASVDPDPVADAFTDQDGFYKIPNLPYGFYRVDVGAVWYYKSIANLQMYAPEVELNFKLRIIIPTPTATPIPGGPGKVFGTVMAQDSETTGPYPLARALVEVFPIKDGEPQDNCIIQPIARAITDENGNYLIGYIPVGNWNISARAEHYQQSIKNFEMIPNGEIKVDFILKPLLEPAPGGIYGRVMGLKLEEDGTSVTESDQVPVAGAKVEVFNAPVYDAKNNIVPGPDKPVVVVFTNEEGKYSVVNLEQGLYMVRVTAEKFYPEHKIAPVADEPVELNFLLKPVLEPMPTPTGSAICGRVVGIPTNHDVEPSPIAGAMVTIQKRINIRSSGESDIEPIIVFTNEDGWYEADDLTSGSYQMKVQADGYLPKFRHVYLFPNQVKFVHFALKPVEPVPTPAPEDGALFGVVFALVPRSYDKPTSPVAGAVVSVFSPGDSEESFSDKEPIAQAVTNDEGQYIIEKIPFGRYIAVAEAAGYKRAVHEVTIPPGVKVRLDFGLPPDIEPTPTPIPEVSQGLNSKTTLRGELIPIPCSGKITGCVFGLDPNGQPAPLANVEVLLFPGFPKNSEDIPASLMSVITDDEGHFEMDDVPMGLYILVARIDGYEPAAKPAGVLPGVTTDVTFYLRPAVSPTPTPAPAGILQGCVTYEKDGAEIPIPSAQIQAICLYNDNPHIIGNRPIKYTATDENGLYKFEDLVPGLYLVMAEAEGFKAGNGEADIKADEVTVLDFKLEIADTSTTDTGTIFGKVMTADVPTSAGVPPEIHPLEGANILVYKVNRSLSDAVGLVPAGSAVSDQNGLFVVDNLRYGLYAVVAKKDGYTEGIHLARIRQFVETKVEFLLMPLGMTPPNPEEGTIYQHDDGHNDDWSPAGAPDVFNMPDASRDGGRLILHCSDNINTFGYWYSPADQIPIEAGAIYKATFHLTSDQPDTSKVPCIRIRFNSKNEQMADMYVINSMGDGAISPGMSGRTYVYYFTLPSSDIAVPVTESGIYVSFDLVNLDPNDAKDATITLNSVSISSIAMSDIPQGTDVLSLDFSTGVYGWTNEFASAFTHPQVISGPYLGLKATNNKSNYGVWVSPPDEITIVANTIYAIDWNVFSDQADLSTVPGIRMRAGDSSNRLIIQKSVFSNAEGDNSPDGLGRTFTQYYDAPAELVGAGLYLAFDMVNFDSTDGSDATTGLHSVTVRAIPTADMP